jgi:hypothetical protein
MSMCLPTSVSILTTALPAGRARNLAFSLLGLSQPFGFALGLVCGGFFEKTAPGWRLGFYVVGAATFLLSVINLWKLPKDVSSAPWTWKMLASDIDWIGVFISSASLGLLSYVFAYVLTIPL